MCGEPLFAAVQPAVLYLLSFLYLVFPVDFAFNLTIVLHFFLAGIFTFLLMKEVEASDEASAIAAVVFTFSGYLLSVHNLLSTLLSVTWLPAVFALYLRTIKRKSWHWATICGLGLYCMFSAGGLEVFVMTSGLLLLTAFFPDFYGATRVELSFFRRLSYCAVSFGCFLLLGAVQVIPFVELISHSIRSAGISYQEAVLWSFAPKNLLYLLVPDIFWQGRDYYWEDQSWLKTIYTGILPFFLFCFFLLVKGKRRFVVIGIMAGAFLLSLGRYNPLYGFLFEWVPFLQVMRYPVKFFLIVIFFLCLAAGWGWDNFREHVLEQGIRWLSGGLFFAFGFLLSLLFLWITFYPEVLWGKFPLDALLVDSKFSPEAVLHNLQRVMLFAMVGSTWIYLIMRIKRLRPLGFYGILILLLSDLFAGNYGFYLAADKKVFHGETQNLKVLRDDPDLYRVFTQKKVMQLGFPYGNHEEYLRAIQDVFVPNLLMERERFDVWGFSILSLKNYYKIITLVQSAPRPDSTNLLNMMNVKYVLWSEALDSPGYELLKKDKKAYLYKNNNYLPRAFLVQQFKVLKDDESFRQTMQSLEFDPAATVLFKQEPAGFPLSPKSIKRVKDSVQIDDYTTNTIKLTVTSSCRQFLVLSETFYPGWKAFVDGRVVPVYEANFAFRAIEVPPGEHAITFSYNPLSFTIGLLISLVSFLGLGVFMVLQRKQSFLKITNRK
jgi:hypothetical protein